MREQVQLIADTHATKDDLKALEVRLMGELKGGMGELKADMAVMTADMKAMEARITARLSGLMIALSAALAAGIKLF